MQVQTEDLESNKTGSFLPGAPGAQQLSDLRAGILCPHLRSLSGWAMVSPGLTVLMATVCVAVLLLVSPSFG